VVAGNGPSNASQIVPIAKIDETILVEPVYVANAAPDKQPAAIRYALLTLPKGVQFGGINRWGTLSDPAMWGDQIVSVELVISDRKISQLLVSTESLINEPRNAPGWEISGIYEPNIARQTAVQREIRFDPARFNTQIGALKDSSVGNLMRPNEYQASREESEKNSENSDDRVRNLAVAQKLFEPLILFILAIGGTIYGGRVYISKKSGIDRAFGVTFIFSCPIALLVCLWRWGLSL
jgi:hypothetical protein